MQWQYQDLINYREKNGALIRIFWLCAAFTALWGILDYAFSLPVFYWFQTGSNAAIYLAPAIINAAMAAALTFAHRQFFIKRPVRASYAIMVGFVVMAAVITVAHYHASVIYAVYVFPIFLSLFYNDRELTVITAILCISAHICAFMFFLPLQPPESYRHDGVDAVLTVAVILVALAIGMRLLNTYSGLMDKIIEQNIKKIVLEREAKEDSLTRLYNHAAFYDYLDLAILGYTKSAQAFCILVLDIDNFKHVNDSYGHAFGDIVLLGLTRIINDSMGKDDIAFRYGGEEFTVISFGDIERASVLAEKIRSGFANLVLEEQPEARFSVSIGVSAYADVFVGKREFFASADRALYDAKRSGKNKAVVAELY